MKRTRKQANSARLASRKILAFHRKHIGPTQGIKIGDASKAVMALLGVKDRTGNLKLGALSAIASHSLPNAVFQNRPFPSVSEKAEFYASWEWTTLRMAVLKANDRRCECCGSSAHDMTVGGELVRIQVDHIKPISKFWELRLDDKNLQVLCAECNRGKGAWDETDWRKVS